MRRVRDVEDRVVEDGVDVGGVENTARPLHGRGETERDAAIELRATDAAPFQDTIGILNFRQVLLGVVHRQLDGVELGVEKVSRNLIFGILCAEQRKGILTVVTR